MNWQLMLEQAPREHSVAELLRDLRQQLEAIARKRPDQRTIADTIIALGNIDLITKLGELPNDEFNGVIIIRAVDGSP